MDFHIECELEENGRWIGEVPELPGVLVYGASSDEATLKAQTLALRVMRKYQGSESTCFHREYFGSDPVGCQFRRRPR